MIRNLPRIFFVSAITILSFSNVKAQSKTINVTDFSVIAKEQKVIIDWKTDGSIATNYFAIQKSTDGVNFKTVAVVLGPDPKQKNCDCYGCFDKYVPKSTKNYYRLVHIDSEGNEQIGEAKILAKP